MESIDDDIRESFIDVKYQFGYVVLREVYSIESLVNVKNKTDELRDRTWCVDGNEEKKVS